MKEEKIAKQLSDILPDRQQMTGVPTSPTRESINAEASSIKARRDAKELARIRYREKQKLASEEAKFKKLEERKSLVEELGLSGEVNPYGATEYQIRNLAEQKKKLEAIETIEAQVVNPLDVNELATKTNGKMTSQYANAVKLQGASRADVLKLLNSLNINVSLQLTKADTANLLACLLTCNSTQLAALMRNKKVPIVIKTVIKRLIEDEKLGNIETIEKLWDRIFGKGPMQLNLPEEQQLQSGIIPNTAVSREAYIVIRDTLINN